MQNDDHPRITFSRDQDYGSTCGQRNEKCTWFPIIAKLTGVVIKSVGGKEKKVRLDPLVKAMPVLLCHDLISDY